jgi:hypothetical protein
MKDDSVRDKGMDRLVESGMRAGLQPASSNCLDAEILAAYVERTLSQRERADCEGHIVSCARCQEHVAALVRLSEADEPARVLVAAAAPARAVRASWFRFAFAGPVLAAVLVTGIYVLGPFKDHIQKGPQINIPTPPPPKQSSLQETQISGGKDVAPKTGERRDIQAKDNKALDDLNRNEIRAKKKAVTQPQTTATGGAQGLPSSPEGTYDQKSKGATSVQVSPTSPPASSSITEAQSSPGNLPKPEPPPTVRDLPVRSREIAPPSVRSKITQAGHGESGVAGGGSGAGPAVAGIVGGLTNNLSKKSTKDEDKVSPSRQQTEATERAVKEEGDVAKPKSEDETVAKTDASSTATNTTESGDKEQKVHSVNQSVEITATAQSVQKLPALSKHVWRVGRHGLIEQKDSNGNWIKHESGVKTHLYAMTFASNSPEVGWAVGQAGTILRSTDGGMTWAQLPSPTTEDILHVSANSELAAVLTTRSGVTWTTSDGGTTWTRAQSQ